MDRVRRLSLSQAQTFDKLIAQHRKIVAAIAVNDPAKITSSLNEHLRQVLPDIDALRANRPEFFDEARQDRPTAHAPLRTAAVQSA